MGRNTISHCSSLPASPSAGVGNAVDGVVSQWARGSIAVDGGHKMRRFTDFCRTDGFARSPCRSRVRRRPRLCEPGSSAAPSRVLGHRQIGARIRIPKGPSLIAKVPRVRAMRGEVDESHHVRAGPCADFTRPPPSPEKFATGSRSAVERYIHKCSELRYTMQVRSFVDFTNPASCELD